uniref:MKRN2 opposite strand protein-like C-terminal domain-containing protein n=1 Tax=Setaria digitata TaxID=48799 RepID=A0A915PY88_9BILA
MKPLILIHNVCGWCSITKSFIARRKLCPKCGTQITDNTSVCVFLPDPFISPTAGCCSILLKPSVNSFSKYKLGDDLHIGLSNSKGFVFSYTNNGIVVESHWNDCLCIYRFSDSKTCDIRMKMFVKKYHSRFTHKHYDKKNWNCYDFVVEFLLDAGVLQRTSHVKDQFVAEHVCKPLQRVLRYYSLLDRLSRSQANFLTLS